MGSRGRGATNRTRQLNCRGSEQDLIESTTVKRLLPSSMASLVRPESTVRTPASKIVTATNDSATPPTKMDRAAHHFTFRFDAVVSRGTGQMPATLVAVQHLHAGGRNHSQSRCFYRFIEHMELQLTPCDGLPGQFMRRSLSSSRRSSSGVHARANPLERRLSTISTAPSEKALLLVASLLRFELAAT